MKNTISKLMLAVLAAALVFAAFPVTSAYAQDENPPVPDSAKLEKAWERLIKGYERMGKAFEDTDAHIARFQEMIDNAAANGKDVSSLQAALDAYAEALTAAEPEYETLGQIIRTHNGFNANGEVVDAEKAFATLQEARDQLKAIKEDMGGTFKALREAVKAFREANKPSKDS